MKLSEKLIKLRKEKGLSQEEFGNEVNVSRQAVSKWENEESKPDIDKIQEIGKKFNISYDYLLNDEIETMEEISKKECKKHKGKVVLKVILVILLIYLLICIYKFIAFYRFYLVANSFSEENYSIDHNFRTIDDFYGNAETCWSTKKYGNQIKKESFSYNNENKFNDDDSRYNSYDITFIDKDKRTSYILIYDEEQEKYKYMDNKNNIENEEEYYDKSENIVKETTFGYIPSSFKEIFLASIDPRVYYVSISKREFQTYSISNDFKLRVQLNNDYLVQSVNMKSERDGYSNTSTFSYNYVQENIKEIEDPLETYKDKIIYEE